MVKYIIVSLNVSARRKKRTENLKDKYAAKLEKLRKRKNKYYKKILWLDNWYENDMSRRGNFIVY